MDIDSGTRGLDQSRHHPLSGLGGTNAESVAPKFDTILSAGGRAEGMPKHAGRRSNTRQKRVRRAANLDRSVEKAVQKALRASPTGWTTWASIAARG
ncbi:hypothetical protein E4U58_005832, partial [Claviceps cyperi]